MARMALLDWLSRSKGKKANNERAVMTKDRLSNCLPAKRRATNKEKMRTIRASVRSCRMGREEALHRELTKEDAHQANGIVSG